MKITAITTPRIIAAFAIVVLYAGQSRVSAQGTDFAKKHAEVKAKFEQRRAKPKNKLVHSPPMIPAKSSTLDEDEAVIGISLGGEARAYPLTMLFGGGEETSTARRWLGVMGRWSLPIYLLHQPILVGTLYALVTLNLV